jgi:DinB superfamily
LSVASGVAHDTDETLCLLACTPAGLNALLRGLPDAWTLRNECAETWTVRDVIAHLADCEVTNWMRRIRTLLSAGESEAFRPFNRTGFTETAKDQSMPELLDRFARLRSENLAAIRELNLSAEDLERVGRHPALGLVTLSQVLATWAAHDLTHLHQISRILAYQYRDAVGPFRAFLGVLQCAGHGS